MRKVIFAVLMMTSCAAFAGYDKAVCAEVKTSTKALAGAILNIGEIPDMELVTRDVAEDSVSHFGVIESDEGGGRTVQQSLFFLRDNHLLYSMYLRYYNNEMPDRSKAAAAVAEQMSSMCFKQLAS